MHDLTPSEDCLCLSSQRSCRQSGRGARRSRAVRSRKTSQSRTHLADKRSRAKRWARVLDSSTWPEVLRRYLLASRAALAFPEAAAAEELAVAGGGAAGDADAAAAAGTLLRATPDEIAVQAALRLGRRDWWELDPAMHVRLLGVLSDDVLQGVRMRAELAVRLESLAQLQVSPASLSSCPLCLPSMRTCLSV
jgi:hypothetical protein